MTQTGGAAPRRVARSPGGQTGTTDLLSDTAPRTLAWCFLFWWFPIYGVSHRQRRRQATSLRKQQGRGAAQPVPACACCGVLRAHLSRARARYVARAHVPGRGERFMKRGNPPWSPSSIAITIIHASSPVIVPVIVPVMIMLMMVVLMIFLSLGSHSGSQITVSSLLR